MSFRSRDQEGFTLVDLMVGCAVAGGIFVALGALHVMQAQQTEGMKLAITRDSVVNELDRALQKTDILDLAYKYSGTDNAGNQAFSYCYLPSQVTLPQSCAPNCCNTSTGAQAVPLVLPDPTSLDSSGKPTRNLAGGAITPVGYTALGARCTTPGPGCPLEVVANFEADCGGASPCAQVPWLSVAYTVRLAQGAANPNNAFVSTVTKRTVIRAFTAGAFNATAVAAGGSTSCAISDGGSVFCWGSNSVGQLGNGAAGDVSIPERVQRMSDGISTLSLGPLSACIIRDGAGQCWGSGTQGTLGNGQSTNSLTPVPVSSPGNQGLQKVSVGAAHACAIIGGAVWCWGDNTYGQLGNGTTGGSSNVPVQVTGITGAQFIAAGGHHSCAYGSVGGSTRIWCWGLDADGQLGDNGNVARATPVATTPAVTSVLGLTAGTGFSCAVGTSSGVFGAWCWGEGAAGQLGNGASVDSNVPVQVAGLTSPQPGLSAGDTHACIVDAGVARCWGGNASGQLGNGGTSGRSTPSAVTGLTGTVQAVSAGGDHSCALVGQAVYCWGANANGQLGNNTQSSSAVPVQVVP